MRAPFTANPGKNPAKPAETGRAAPAHPASLRRESPGFTTTIAAIFNSGILWSCSQEDQKWQISPTFRNVAARAGSSAGSSLSLCCFLRCSRAAQTRPSAIQRRHNPKPCQRPNRRLSPLRPQPQPRTRPQPHLNKTHPQHATSGGRLLMPAFRMPAPNRT